MGTSLTPTPAEVALLVLARTRQASGAIGAFTETTKPTLEQVEGIISSVRTRVFAKVGAGFDSDTVIREDDDGTVTLGDVVRETITNGAAARIERALEPEAAAATDSAYQQLLHDYEDGLKVLEDSVRSDPADTQGFASVGMTSPLLAAAARFPPTIGGPEIPGEES